MADNSATTKVAAFVVTALFVAGSHHHHRHGHGGLSLFSTTSISAGAERSHRAWARAFLKAIPEPRTGCNMNAVVSWELHEGGGFGNQAAHNPLNVNPGPGAGWPGYPAIGAWAFPDTRTGLRYTVRTIRNGYYGNILAALHRGGDAQDVCNQIMNSPWAASHYNEQLTASC